MANFTLVTVLPIENNPNSICRVKVECAENGFSMIIFDDNTAYKGEASAEYISDHCKNSNKSVSEYLEECRTAFQSPHQFIYSMADNHFHIKKSILSPTGNWVKMKFVSIKLHEVDFKESILGMLDAALSENDKSVKKVEELQSVNKALQEGNESLLEQIKRLQSAKNEMENVLYFRFLNLLNSKKKKIKELKRKSGIEMEEDTESELDEEMPLQNYSSNVYDADTDVDEEIKSEVVTDECKPEESSSKIEPVTEKPVEQAKQEPTIKEFLKSNENSRDEANSSKARSIFDHMSILDPTIPFVG